MLKIEYFFNNFILTRLLARLLSTYNIAFPFVNPDYYCVACEVENTSVKSVIADRGLVSSSEDGIFLRKE